MKKIIIMGLLSLLVFSGCDPTMTITDLKPQDDEGINPNGTPTRTITNPPSDPTYQPQMITLLSWNIQNLGQKKAHNDFIMNTIAVKVNQYDIVAIQELSNINEIVDEDCSRNANAMGETNYKMIQNALTPFLDDGYRFAISPQIDDERYMFIYNANKISFKGCSVAYDDNSGQLCEKSDKGLMKREPYICDFGVGGASFRIGNVHTSPSNNFNELMGLNIIYQQELEKDNDLIMVGDMNLDCDYIKDGNPLSEYKFIKFDDTTVYDGTTCGYDVIMYDNLTQIKILKAGLDRKNVNGEISDHYPVYAQIGINP